MDLQFYSYSNSIGIFINFFVANIDFEKNSTPSKLSPAVANLHMNRSQRWPIWAMLSLIKFPATAFVKKKF